MMDKREGKRADHYRCAWVPTPHFHGPANKTRALSIPSVEIASVVDGVGDDDATTNASRDSISDAVESKR
jgi:hypothetical protein